jgi:hypothetical protein
MVPGSALDSLSGVISVRPREGLEVAVGEGVPGGHVPGVAVGVLVGVEGSGVAPGLDVDVALPSGPGEGEGVAVSAGAVAVGVDGGGVGGVVGWRHWKPSDLAVMLATGGSAESTSTRKEFTLPSDPPAPGNGARGR